MPRNPRRFDLERKYDAQPEVKAKRAERNRARRAYENANGELPAGMDVDHKKPMAKGGTSAKSNLRAVPASKNRSFPRTKTARMK